MRGLVWLQGVGTQSGQTPPARCFAELCAHLAPLLEERSSERIILRGSFSFFECTELSCIIDKS